MRVCLVSPPTVSQVRDLGVDPAAARALAAQSAPLGILTLAARLEQHGHEAVVVDLNRELSLHLHERETSSTERFADAMSDRLVAEEAALYGFTTIWSSYPTTLRIVERIHELDPSAALVLGGPQASVVDVATLERFPAVGAILRGEADETLPHYLEALAGEARLESVRGLTVRRRGEIVTTPDPAPVAELDELPFPAFHLYGDVSGFRHLPLELGRGCPFACTFCSTNEFFSRRFRVKSPARLIADMRLLNECYGATSFDLIHDMFTANKARVVEFCEAMIDADTGFTWFCSARSDCVTDELLELMAAAGCRSIFFGIETGSARLQAAIDKHLDVEEAAARLRTASGAGMLTTVSLILGHVDETREDLRATIRFLVDSLRDDLIDPQIHLLTPLSGTPLEREFRDRLLLDDVYGDLSHSGWPQGPAERGLISELPGIFGSFYSLPLMHFERRYVQELRLFLYHAIPRHRWLTVALQLDGVDVLDFFDEWLAWVGTARPPWLADGGQRLEAYGTDDWSSALLEFVEERCAPAPGGPIAALLSYSRALDSALGNNSPSSPARVVRAEGVTVLHFDVDLPGLIACLRDGVMPASVEAVPKTLVTRARGHRVDVLELSPLLTRGVELCDGSRTLEEVVERLSERCGELAGLPPEAVARLAIQHLAEQRFVSLPAARAGRRPPARPRPAVVAPA